MKPILFVGLVLLGTQLVLAQETPAAPDPMAGAKARLATALEKTATLRDVAFAAKWGPAEDDDADAAATAQQLGMMQSGKASGSWHDGLLHVRFEGDAGDELAMSGRFAIAKDTNNDWCARSTRFADGNATSFVPDPERLLRLLAGMDLAVVHRAVGTLDERPVEILSVALNTDQVADLAWSDAIPDTVTNGGAFRLALMAAAGGGARAAAPRPDATVDIAITLDPALGLIQRVQFRSWTKANDGQRVFFRGGAGAIRVVTGGGNRNRNEKDDTDDADKTDAKAPLQYEDGLPQRSRKKMDVNDLDVRLTDHGTHKAPDLGAAAARLLRR
ncbi:MAG: hypothetical protein JNK78_20615 [Planctomycetes bacterium]|nr:hypothetical protein [Planctomycetota bacterium]